MEKEWRFERPLSYAWPEATALGLLLALALFLRLWQLAAVPPGLHYDEAIDLRQALLVTQGARPLYVAEGWGREALYYYLVAIVLHFVPYNPVALRMAAVLCGMGILVTVYFLVRHWHSRLAAWLTVAWLSLTYWPLSASRFGVRHISLPFVLGLAVLAFWWAWGSETVSHSRGQLRRFVLAGFLLGLTLYTYQPARFVPFIFLAFALYLFFFHRSSLRARQKGLGVLALTAALTALPLVILLATNWSAEAEQRAFTIQPLLHLLAGDPKLVLQNSLATLQVFTRHGDPLASYNIPGRPIFVPVWSGAFFFAGLVLSIWRWRQPVYMFVLIWLVIMLIPTILTLSAPNFNRMIATQAPVMFLAAVPMAELGQWMARQGGRYGVALAVAITVFCLGLTGSATWRDYFTQWPAVPETREPLNHNIMAIARYLENEADHNQPVVISSAHIEDSAPYIVGVSLDRRDLVVRWVDTGQALALPAGHETARLLVTADRWLDDDLRAFLDIPVDPVQQVEEFTAYDVTYSGWPSEGMMPVYFLAPGAAWPGNLHLNVLTEPYPYVFCGCRAEDTGLVALESLQLMNNEVQPGQVVTVVTTWRIERDGQAVSLASFTHLVDRSGQLVGQQDGLGYPPHSWHTGDRFAQVHHLSFDPDLTPGHYWLQLGLYRRETGNRWLVVDQAGAPIADRLVWGPIPVVIEGE
jgi:4-amino-4-deoxy-L-arabinose transferase-like glycosyltransferase